MEVKGVNRRMEIPTRDTMGESGKSLLNELYVSWLFPPVEKERDGDWRWWESCLFIPKSVLLCESVEDASYSISPGEGKMLLYGDGPAFWGLINPQWSLCSKGRRQSPVNVEPSKLLYDPSLRPIHIDKTPTRTTMLLAN
ncbi:Carbonic anhydrase-related protein 10 [Folsomia candida]|uniref:Carbonic anhydrase-related protein 10 n=1 Tax=Folsomia candida TaxID=158441 RepID=A0A226E576_FOLCA|nr:Carbonic anhydrase-related protein 10 [Folsomia candida]